MTDATANGDAAIVAGAIHMVRGTYTKNTAFVTANDGADLFLFKGASSEAVASYTAAHIVQTVVLQDAADVTITAANFS